MSRGALLLRLLPVVAVLVGASANPAGADRGSGWFRIQFEGRIAPGDRLALETTGLNAIQYVPENAYLGYGTPESAASAGRLQGVRHVRPLEVSEKVDGGMRPARGPVPVVVVAYGPRAADVRDRLAALGTVADDYRLAPDGKLHAVVARLSAWAILRAAADPAVQYVGPAATGFLPEDEGTAQIVAGNVEDGHPVPGYESFLGSRGIDGDGVIVTIADSGIDERHPEFAGRIVGEFYGQEGDPGGHGTHVAGIVGGKGAVLPTTTRARDHEDMLLGVGIAPAVSFIDQTVILSPWAPVWPPSDFEPLTRESVRLGSVGWNGSWHTGGDPGAGYVERARSLDVVTRDADLATPGNQPFTMVFSAGNRGPDPRTITQPKEAKNVIVVGSTWSHRVVSPVPGSIDTVSTFSSRGPAADGRVLPTVVAPGEDVVSSRGLTSTESCTLPTSVGGVWGYTGGLAHYTGCSGTSMAAPHVTGAVALIHDWWRGTHGGDDPSPAMAKALVVNTARDVGEPDIPNGDEGWGRLDLGNLFDPSEDRIYVDESVVFRGAGDDPYRLRVTAVDPSRPLKATLVWTDAPAVPGADPALVNDLDLTLVGPDGTTWRGNGFAQGRSVSGGDPDRLNNVENVFLHDPGAAAYELEIASWSVPGDAIPGDGHLTDQDFALVVSNATAALD